MSGNQTEPGTGMFGQGTPAIGRTQSLDVPSDVGLEAQGEVLTARPAGKRPAFVLHSIEIDATPHTRNDLMSIHGPSVRLDSSAGIGRLKENKCDFCQ